jgi:NAD(P)-dependent dehydrogenase (short-subunit alcohol dehydrogenase family)
VKDRVVLVTGSTDGIGKHTALELARRGATVLVHGRDAARGAAVRAEIQQASGNPRVELLVADLSSMRQVRDLAAQVKARHDRLHVLINNAGVFMRKRRLTADGFETTFAVNHLAHFLLTHLLLDTIAASAPARIITVSSGTHHSGRIDFDNLQSERHFDGYDAYAASKLANVLFSNELADRLAGTRVTSNSLHPGVIRTKLLRAGFGASGGDLEEGAATSVYLASAPEVEHVTGKYFVRKRETPASSTARDKQLMQALWRASEELLGL